LAVGSGPFSIAIDPAGTYAYVANEGGTVTKINLSTFATVGSALAVGSNPHSIAIDPTGTYAYVANYGASTVTKINLSTFLTVGSALAVGSSPFGIAIDPTGTYAYTANEGGNSVTKINLSTFATVGSALAVGSNPYSIAIDPTGTYAYVANYGAGTVTKIDLLTIGSAGIYTLPLVGGPKVCTPLAPNDFLWTAIYIGTQVTGPIFGSTGAVLVPLLNAGCTVARSRCGYVIQADTATLASFNPSTIIASSFNYWMGIS
jgi:YVTN family beta-propeller protein